VLVSASGVCAALAQHSAPAEPYDVDAAYQVYHVLLPQEESSRFAKGALVIQKETVSNPIDEGPRACLTPEAAKTFKDAIADYERVNKKQWLLEPRFQIEKPYEIVGSDVIAGLLKSGGWRGFDKRYLGSGGYIIVSAVGFNADKTQAIVYSGSLCGSLCGRWSFHLLEKVAGKWREVPGVSCFSVS